VFYIKGNNGLNVKPAKSSYSKSIGYERIVKCGFVCRNYLAHRSDDAINAVLAAVGYNFRLLLRWLRLLLFRILTAIVATPLFRFS
jgi:hypothetical protein